MDLGFFETWQNSMKNLVSKCFQYKVSRPNTKITNESNVHMYTCYEN